MKRTFLLRILSGYLAVALVFILATVLIVFNIIDRHQMDAQALNLRAVAEVLASQLQSRLWGDEPALNRLVNDMGAATGMRITVVESGGKVLADSRKDHLRMESHWDRPEISAAMEGREGRAIRESHTLNQRMLYVAEPLWRDGHVVGAVRVSLSSGELDTLFGRLRVVLAQVVGIVFLVSLALAYFLSRGLSRPVAALAEAAGKVSGGNFDTRIHMRGSGELRELGEAFNSMTGRIQALFSDLSSEREQLAVVLSSIREGVMVVDRDCRITLATENFRSLCGDPHPEGKFYWEVLRNADLSEALIRAREQREGTTSELELTGRFFVCSLAWVAGRQETVVLFFDVTERRKLEEIKRDLAVSVAHEFRTPLTSIRGFVEALEDEVGEPSHLEYLAVIRRNTERLIRITEDLQLIARVESRGRLLDLERLELGGVLEGLRPMFQPMLGQKGLSLALEVDPDLPPIQGDRFMVEQVFVNLVENAIRYTREGGISVRLRPGEQSVVAEVSDTGEGIPEKDLARVFERFYVVDRSRSRQAGGTGLGLAIVKNIVAQHNGRIDVRSTVGKGTTFTVILPTHPSDGGQAT